MTKAEIEQKILELKAQGYDCAALIENAQRQLQQVNQQLQELTRQLNEADDGDADTISA